MDRLLTTGVAPASADFGVCLNLLLLKELSSFPPHSISSDLSSLGISCIHFKKNNKRHE